MSAPVNTVLVVPPHAVTSRARAVVGVNVEAPPGERHARHDDRTEPMTPVFAARRRAEEFARPGRGFLDRPGRRRTVLRAARAGRRHAGDPGPEAAARVRGRPARPADGRGRHRPGPRRHQPPHPPGATSGPRTPARRGGRRARARRRHHVDGDGRPERPARRRPLPGQARHRERRRPDSASARDRRARPSSPAPATASTRPPSSAGGRPRGQRGGRRHAQRLHRPGRRGVGPAARRLQPDRQPGLGRPSCATSRRAASTSSPRSRPWCPRRPATS